MESNWSLYTIQGPKKYQIKKWLESLAFILQVQKHNIKNNSMIHTYYIMYMDRILIIQAVMSHKFI
jgi:hypothetical protein